MLQRSLCIAGSGNLFCVIGDPARNATAALCTLASFAQARKLLDSCSHREVNLPPVAHAAALSPDILAVVGADGRLALGRLEDHSRLGGLAGARPRHRRPSCSHRCAGPGSGSFVWECAELSMWGRPLFFARFFELVPRSVWQACRFQGNAPAPSRLRRLFHHGTSGRRRLMYHKPEP